MERAIVPVLILGAPTSTLLVAGAVLGEALLCIVLATKLALNVLAWALSRVPRAAREPSSSPALA
jgi:hypothetical protein